MLVLINISLIKSECPKQELLSPCTCILSWWEAYITCNGDIDIKSVFLKLSQNLPDDKKQFRDLQISNTPIHELEANTFSQITFGYIAINNAKNLTAININAFNGTDLVTTNLAFNNAPLVNKKSTHFIFDIINKFINLQIVSISNSNIEEIPSYAFNSLKYLSGIYFTGSLKSIQDDAFYNLHTLNFLDITNNKLDVIHTDAFKFKDQSEVTFIIIIDCYMFNTSHIENNSLTNIGRPVRIWSEVCKTDYLDAKKFKPFFDDNDSNIIWSKDFNISCNDQRDDWLIKSGKYSSKVKGLTCS